VGVDKIERCPQAAGRVSSEDDDDDGKRRMEATAIGVCRSPLPATLLSPAAEQLVAAPWPRLVPGQNAETE
jgi:hypothetical protein